MNLGFAFQAEEVNARYCYKKVSKLVQFIFELRRCWWRRGEDVKDSKVPREDGTIFASNNPTQMCSSRTRYTPPISCVEQELQKIVEYETGEK